MRNIFLMIMLFSSLGVFSQNYPNNEDAHFIYFDGGVTLWGPDYENCSWIPMEDKLSLNQLNACNGSVVRSLTFSSGYCGVNSMPLYFQYSMSKKQRCDVGNQNGPMRIQNWQFSITFDRAIYGKCIIYNPNASYPNVCNNFGFGDISNDSWFELGISPPKPKNISLNGAGINSLTEGDKADLKVVSADVNFPDNIDNFYYEIDYRTTSNGLWSPYTGTVPAYSSLPEPTVKGKRLYLRARICRRGESDSNPVKYSPYLPLEATVLANVNASITSVDGLNCSGDPININFHIGEIASDHRIRMYYCKNTVPQSIDNDIRFFYPSDANKDYSIGVSNLGLGSYIVSFAYERGSLGELLNTSTNNISAVLKNTNLPFIRTASITQAISCSGGKGIITLTPSGGSGQNYTYSCNSSPFSSSNEFTLPANTYTFLVRDCNGKQGPPTTLELKEPNKLILGDPIIKNVSCTGGSDGKIAFKVKGGGKPYRFTFSGGGKASYTSSDSVFINLIAADNYTITVSDANNCTTLPRTFRVIQPKESLSLAVNLFSNVSCFGGNNGLVKLQTSGGTRSYQYSMGENIWKTDSLFSGLIAKDYTFYVKDINGCSSEVKQKITNPSLLTIKVESITHLTCFNSRNGRVKLSAAGGTKAYQFSRDGLTWQDDSTFVLLEAKNYTFYVRDNKGCTKNINATVSQPNPLVIGIASFGDVLCYGEQNGYIVLTVKGGTKPYSFSMDNVNWKSDSTFNGLFKGNYSIYLKDKNGCEQTISKEITEPLSPLTASTNKVNVTCFGLANGSITVTASGGTPPYKYSKDNGVSFITSLNPPTFTGLDPNSYQIVVKDAKGCVTIPIDVIISQPPLLSANAKKIDVKCFDAGDGIITVTASGGTSPYQYSKDNGSSYINSNEFTNLTPTTYSVVVKDAKGCEYHFDPIEIVQPTSALRAAITRKDIDCHGAKDGEIRIVASGGTLPYRYSKDNGTTYSNFTASTPFIFNGLDAIKYTVLVEDVNKCAIAPENITITQPAEPFIFSISSSMNVTCPGGSNGQVNLKAEGGTPFVNNRYLFSMDSITWNSSAGTYRFDALAARLDTFRVKDSKGCQLSLIHEVIQPNEIKPNAVTTNVTCKDDRDGKLSFAVTGGTSPYKLNITGPNSFSYTAVDVSQIVNLSNLSVGDYTLNLMDNAGCPSISTHTVTKPELALQLTVRSSIKPSCSGRTDGEVKVKASGGWGGYTFRLLSNGAPSADSIFRGLVKGSYLFETSDLLGCKAIANLQLNQPDTLKIAIKKITNLTCNSNSTGKIEVKTKGGTKDYRYSFRVGSTHLANSIDSVFSNLSAADSYWVKAIDNHGCTDSVKAVVTQPERLTINISNRHSNGYTINCPGKKDTIWVKPLGGTASYTLTPRSGPNAGYHPKGFALFDKPNGDYIFTITDANGCFKVDTAKISNLPAPKIKGITITDARCANTTDGQITINPWSATGFEKISWYAIGERDTVLIKHSADTFVNGILGGRYISMVTDTLTCTHDTTITVGAPPAIEIALNKRRDPKCFGNADGNLSVIASGRNPSDFKYVWYNQNQVKVSEVDSTGAIPSGSYSVVVTDLIGCSKTSTHSIVDPKSLQPNMPSLVTICANQYYLADAGVSGNTFIWSSGDRFSASGRTVTLTEAGVYTVMVTDAKGCSGKGTLTLEKTNEIINANFMMADRVSVGDTLVLIEMSWPIPEAILWHYPSSFEPVYSNDYSIYLVPQKEGVDSIGLTSQVGACWEMIYKKIIVESAKDRGDKSIAEQPLIREVAAFPNPNRGDFSVKVDLNRVADVLVEVYSVYGNRLFFKHEAGLLSYKMNINLFQTPGIYLVRIASGNEHRSLRVVVE